MASTIAPFSQFPRAVRPLPDPLALYLRPGRNDQKPLLEFAATGDAAFHGVIFDASIHLFHKELLERTLAQRQDAVLDPRTQPLATEGGYSAALGRLPWGGDRPHAPADFLEVAGRRRVGEIAAFALDRGYTQVMAPTHILSGANDPWLAIDVDNARHLRDALDSRNGMGVPLIYPLAIPYAAMRNRDELSAIVTAIQRVPAASLWLAVEGFGSRRTPTATLNFLDVAAELHRLGIPIIADAVGGLVGLSLLAFGAVGGLAHGVTFGEHRDTKAWKKPRDKDDSFGLVRRVYLPSIDMRLKPDQARMLFDAAPRAKAAFGCRNPNCCPRGIIDMLENPARHFLFQRTSQISELTRIPPQLRPQRFLDQHVRPATDHALAIANIKWEKKEMADAASRHRKRLDLLRVSLGKRAAAVPPTSFAQLPQTRVARERMR
jgi:hypothetical protein